MNKLNGTAAPAAIHTYHQTPVSGDSYRYVGAGGSLYRDFNYGVGGANAIITGLTGSRWPMAAMRPLLGGKTYSYISDGVVNKKDDGTAVASWGVAAPTVQATLAFGAIKKRIIDAFDSITGWSILEGSVGLSTDTSFFVEGTSSMKAAAQNSNSATVKLTKTLAVDLSTFDDASAARRDDYIYIWFATSHPDVIKRVDLILGINGYSQIFRKNFQYTDSPLDSLTADTFVQLITMKKDFTPPVDTSLTWAQVNRLKLIVSFRSPPPADFKFWVDDWKLAGGGFLNGAYQFRWIYVVKSGTQVLAKSNPYDPVLAGVESNQIETKRHAVALSGMTASADAQVTHKWIYRSLADDFSAFFFDGEITNATTTYTSSKSDAELGARLAFDNDAPPAVSDIAGPHFDRIWGVDASLPDRVVFSKAKEPEAFPPTYYILAGTPADPVKKLVLFSGVLYAFTVNSIYEVNGSTEDSFFAAKTRAERGTVAPRSVALAPQGMYYLAKDGIYLFDGLHSRLLTQTIDPVFYGTATLGIDEFNMAQASICWGEYFDGKYFLAYPHGGNTTNTRVLVLDEATNRFYRWDFSGANALFVEKKNNFLVVGASDAFAYYTENGLKNLTGDAPNDVATIQLALQDNYGHDGLKLAKDLYIDVDAPSAITVTPIIDGSAKTAISTALSTERVIRRIRLVGFKGRLFEWRLKSASFFRLFGLRPGLLDFRRDGYSTRQPD